jgi:hypothetical protein
LGAGVVEKLPLEMFLLANQSASVTGSKAYEFPGKRTAGIFPARTQEHSVCLVVCRKAMTSVVVSIVLRLRRSLRRDAG